ncbi:MAG: hypothetical protein K8T91_06990 [Planctomycetes bacterium]|nr:hypothetical protein [Planctomycetota bacterium]
MDQIDAIREEYIPLSRLAMKECGPAAQTLGGLYQLCGGKRRRTFASQESIAAAAWLSPRVVREHLPKLVAAGYLEYRGREALGESWRRRRTCTYVLTAKAIDHKAPYGVLPRWAAEHLSKWSERAIYSLLGAQWMLIQMVADNETGCADDRMELSLTTVQRMTGLTRPAVVQGFWSLSNRRIIDRYDNEVALNIDFRVPPSPLKGSKKDGGINRSGSAVGARSTMKNHGGGVVKKTAVPSKNHGGTPVKKTAASLSSKVLSSNSYPKILYGQTFADANGDRVGEIQGKTSEEEKHPEPDSNRGWAAARYERACKAIGHTGLPCKDLQGVCLAIAEGRLDEQVLADAIEGVRIKQPRDPLAYLMTCLAKSGAFQWPTNPRRPAKLPAPKPLPAVPLVRSVDDALADDGPRLSEAERRREFLNAVAEMEGKSG